MEKVAMFHNRTNRFVSARSAAEIGHSLPDWFTLEGRLYHLDSSASVPDRLAQYAERPELEGKDQVSRWVLFKVDDTSDAIPARLQRDPQGSGLVWVTRGDPSQVTPDSDAVLWDEMTATASGSIGEIGETSAPAAQAPPVTVSAPRTQAPEGDAIIIARLLRKNLTAQGPVHYLFFDIEFTARALDKPARAIKGMLLLQDLFGETKLPITWTIEYPLSPGQVFVEKGKGFKYNKFMVKHVWGQTTALENMRAVFRVMSILYADGSRRDFRV